MFSLKDWNLDPPEPIKVRECAHCGEDLYEGEDVYRVGSDTFYCLNCVIQVTLYREELL